MLKYEEIIYVIAGEFSLTLIEDGGESVAEGKPGDIIALHKGATVRYGGTAGMHLFLAITPVNWREIGN
ncbi:hypothetical protein AB0D91_40560 [Streptomyces canus]|uniref:hypothetical protein n=1 Tax=Streptomyces canus TaxID=58343 RepID=UPI0033DDFC44